MIELKLSLHQFQELLKAGYSLDVVYLLRCMEEGIDVVSENDKIQALIQNIDRKSLVIDGKLTMEGRSIMDFLSHEGEPKKYAKKKADADWFTNWWKAYPATDTFICSGKKFNGTRALRARKEECKAKLNKILLEGEYKIEDMIEAIKLEIDQKMKNSLKTGENKLSFMQNSLTYLTQRTWESYVELVRQGHKAEESTILTKSTDI